MSASFWHSVSSYTASIITFNLFLAIGEDYMLNSDEVRFTNQNSVFETKPVKVLLHADGKKETPEGFRIILDGPDNAVYQQRDISVVIRDE